MNPYDAKSKCKKCNYATNGTKYAAWTEDNWATPEGRREALTRTCGRCGFVWFEAVLA